MSEETKVVLVVLLLTLLLIPAMVWLVRAAKRNGGAIMTTGLMLFTALEKFGGSGAIEHVDRVKDPERKKRAENGDGDPPEP